MKELITQSITLIFNGVLLISGCAQYGAPTVKLNPELSPPLTDKVYEYTDDSASDVVRSFTFKDCPLKHFVLDVADEFGVYVSFGDGLGDSLINGTFTDITINDLLAAVAVQLGVKYSYDGKIHYLHQSDFSKRFLLVGRFSGDENQLTTVLSGLIGNENDARYSVVGNKFFIHDTAENLKLYVNAIKDFDEMSLRSYVAEVFFLRVSNSDLIDAQARLDATGIDILKQTWSIKDLFNCYIDADIQRKSQHVLQRPIIYCSEGKESTLNVGSEITLEKKAISTEGYTSTTGWESFSDGLQIKLLISRMRSNIYQADFDLTISKYDDNGDTVSGILPRVDKTGLNQSGVVITAGEPILLGSLNTQTKKKGFGFITANAGASDESILVFLRVREIDLNSAQKKFIFDKTAIDAE